MTKSSTYHRLILMLLAICYVVNVGLAIVRTSVVSDETDHFNYAVRLVKGNPDKTKPFDDASCLPLSVVNTLPRAVHQLTHPGYAATDNGENDIRAGRWIMVIFGLLLGFYIYRWSYEWYGKKAALISTALFVFCPNLTAYAGFVMTDLFAALFTIIPLYHFWKYRNGGGWRQFFYFAIALSLAQVAKQSLSHLYFIFFILWVVGIAADFRRSEFAVPRILKKFAVLVLIQLVVINIGFQFRHFGKSLKEYSFTSIAFSKLTDAAGPIASVPLPLPEPYLKGLDQTLYMVQLGAGNKDVAADNYLFGEKRKKPFAYYYFAIVFFKTPLITLIAVALSIFLMIRRINRSFWRNECFLVLPVVYFLLYFNLGVSIQGGLRHVLMIYPLLYVLCGRLIELDGAKGRAAALAGAVWLLASFYYYCPNLVPYTNETIPDKKMAYRVMADSNLDLGQAQRWLRHFLAGHPEYKPAPLQPAAGKFYIGVNDLLDLYDEGNYTWLLDHFKPGGHVAHSILLFDIDQADIAKITAPVR